MEDRPAFSVIRSLYLTGQRRVRRVGNAKKLDYNKRCGVRSNRKKNQVGENAL